MSTAEIIAAVFGLLNIVGGVVGKYVIGELRERIRALEAANNSAVLIERLDRHRGNIEALWDQVGRDSQSGMRKVEHDAYNLGLANIERFEQAKDRMIRIEAKMDRLETRVDER